MSGINPEAALLGWLGPSASSQMHHQRFNAKACRRAIPIMGAGLLSHGTLHVAGSRPSSICQQQNGLQQAVRYSMTRDAYISFIASFMKKVLYPIKLCETKPCCESAVKVLMLAGPQAAGDVCCILAGQPTSSDRVPGRHLERLEHRCAFPSAGRPQAPLTGTTGGEHSSSTVLVK